MSARVAIVDSGGANIASLVFALERLGADAVLTADAAVIRDAERVILPGVGAAADAMTRLVRHGLEDVIPRLEQPVLGICLGMQLLARDSAEHDTTCLGVLPLSATRLEASAHAPVPHMGWSRIRKRHDHPLLDGIDDGSWFYFVHSYALPAGEHSLADATHAASAANGDVTPAAFCAIAAYRNFVAAQCHPERSASAGARLLRNFLALPV
ncbi:MAG: imidazole glycerol phosphate synthase subunit HisH [Woeseiaceae bacterium]|nr:imidazole glycerol phosphate synthase subunit HisH [Woeseiaceae bacterium]